MRRIILICVIGLGGLAVTAPVGATPTPSPADRIDACLRAHGWSYGLLALQGAEIRHGHPNGLIRICGGTNAV
jgi:hypothetical protein